jgi:hypothetical protein
MILRRVIEMSARESSLKESMLYRAKIAESLVNMEADFCRSVTGLSFFKALLSLDEGYRIARDCVA